MNTPTLSEVLRNLNAEDHAAIRQSYYKAAEGLWALVEALETAKRRDEVGGVAGHIAKHKLAHLQRLAANVQDAFEELRTIGTIL